MDGQFDGEILGQFEGLDVGLMEGAAVGVDVCLNTLCMDEGAKVTEGSLDMEGANEGLFDSEGDSDNDGAVVGKGCDGMLTTAVAPKFPRTLSTKFLSAYTTMRPSKKPFLPSSLTCSS